MYEDILARNHSNVSSVTKLLQIKQIVNVIFRPIQNQEQSNVNNAKRNFHHQNFKFIKGYVDDSNSKISEFFPLKLLGWNTINLCIKKFLNSCTLFELTRDHSSLWFKGFQGKTQISRKSVAKRGCSEKGYHRCTPNKNCGKVILCSNLITCIPSSLYRPTFKFLSSNVTKAINHF